MTGVGNDCLVHVHRSGPRHAASGRRCILCARRPRRLLTHPGSHQLRSGEQGGAGSTVTHTPPDSAIHPGAGRRFNGVLLNRSSRLGAPIKRWRFTKDAHAGRPVGDCGLGADDIARRRLIGIGGSSGATLRGDGQGRGCAFRIPPCRGVDPKRQCDPGGSRAPRRSDALSVRAVSPLLCPIQP